MDNEKLVRNWQKKIIDECTKRLNRPLTDKEREFIFSRGGFIALELIEDTVMALEGDDLMEYLNESSEQGA